MSFKTLYNACCYYVAKAYIVGERIWLFSAQKCHMLCFTQCIFLYWKRFHMLYNPQLQKVLLSSSSSVSRRGLLVGIDTVAGGSWAGYGPSRRLR